jgi:hypothetical protein
MEFPIEIYRNGIYTASNIAHEVDAKVKRVFWTNEQIDEFFAKRSATEILYNGSTGFMNPCLDLTLVSSSIMSSKRIPHYFVIEEHLPVYEFPFNRLHFALEFKNGNQDYVMDYKGENEVHIYSGKYKGRQDIPSAGIIRILGDKINPYKALFKSLGYETMGDLINDKFKGYSLKTNLIRLKQDNSIENYKDYLRRNGENIKIITKQ